MTGLRTSTLSTLALSVISIGIASIASATDGYFAHGYGVKSQGVGGVGIALPQDALVSASNPAGLAWVGARLDIGATWFRPQREAEIENNAGPINGKYDANDKENFIIPEIGYNKQVSETLNTGVAVYGNGGMNTDYKTAVPLFGNRRAGIDLIQVFIKPALAWKLSPTQSVGVGLNLAYQRFEAKGLQNFDNAVSEAPGYVTNKGHDSSYGIGAHIGWLGHFGDHVTLGASYQTKTSMSKFDKYRGLFAEQGDFDIPASYGLGIAIKLTPSWTVAGDVQRIRYSDVDSVSNSISNFFAQQQLGSDRGAGFGWRDVTAYKIGTLYQVNDQLTLRAGYNHATQPIARGETLLNILAPAVVQDHLTLGATWKFENKSELSFSYVHAFENKVNGNNSIDPSFGGGDVNLKMYQDSLGIAYAWAL